MILRRMLVISGLLLVAGASVAADKPADVLVREGKKYRNDGDFAAAKEFFAAALKLDARHADAIVNMAWLSNEEQDHDEAVTLAEAALKIEPGSSDALFELGYAQLKQKLYLRAVTSLRRSIEKDHRNWTAYGYLIEALRAVGETEEADRLEATRRQKMNPTRIKD
jgi:tetratricopeptide (TPR) repeat protein